MYIGMNSSMPAPSPLPGSMADASFGLPSFMMRTTSASSNLFLLRGDSMGSTFGSKPYIQDGGASSGVGNLTTAVNASGAGSSAAWSAASSVTANSTNTASSSVTSSNCAGNVLSPRRHVPGSSGPSCAVVDPIAKALAAMHGLTDKVLAANSSTDELAFSSHTVSGAKRKRDDMTSAESSSADPAGERSYNPPGSAAEQPSPKHARSSVSRAAIGEGGAGIAEGADGMKCERNAVANDLMEGSALHGTDRMACDPAMTSRASERHRAVCSVTSVPTGVEPMSISCSGGEAGMMTGPASAPASHEPASLLTDRRAAAGACSMDQHGSQSHSREFRPAHMVASSASLTDVEMSSSSPISIALSSIADSPSGPTAVSRHASEVSGCGAVSDLYTIKEVSDVTTPASLPPVTCGTLSSMPVATRATAT